MKLLPVFYILLVCCYACTEKQKNTGQGAALNYKAYEFQIAGKSDSAFYYYDQAKNQFLEERDSLNAGSCIVNMAIIAKDQGDWFGSQELSLGAISYFDETLKEHHPYILSNYNTLGVVSNNLAQYRNAIRFYQKSLEFVPDSSYALIVTNNLGNSYRNEEEFEKAIAYYQSVLASEKNKKNYARTLSNYANAKWLQDSTYKAESELEKALQIRIDENDLWGQNASYSHLADYFKGRDPQKSLAMARRMFAIANQLGSPPDRLEALQKLIPLTEGGDSKYYFDQYRLLEDSIQLARNNAKNQFALIRYETEKHKADNLQLLQERTVRNMWIGGLAFVLIAGSSFALFWYRRRARRLERNARAAIRESQLKTSKKVHDVVANGIYRIMSEVENSPNIDQDHLLDQMEELYEQSRDISYDTEPAENNEHDFQEALRQLLSSFATEQTRVLII